MLDVFVAVLKILLFATARSAKETPDEIRVIWHRYEAGDLTHWEFNRLRKTPPRTIAA